MPIRKRLIQNENYYEYSTDYFRKYAINAIWAVIAVLILAVIMYFIYFTVPSKSFVKNTHSEVLSNAIVDSNGKYFSGVFTNIPLSIPIVGDMREVLYLYLFHDNHIVFWKFYKNGKKRDFYYNAFNLLDKDLQTFNIKEVNKDFLDFYDNFIKAQFKKSAGSFYLEIPYFFNTQSRLKTSITNFIEANFSFEFKDFYASMVNWNNNRALYIASFYGVPSGKLIVPGSETILTSDSGILAFETIGNPPSRYEQEIIVALVYTPLSTDSIPIFIYKARPASLYSKMIRFLYNGKWYTYTDFESHQYKDSIDDYSKENGFSFVYNKSSDYIKERSGIWQNYRTKTDQGIMTGYFTVDKKQFQINGTAVKEYMHGVF